MLLEETIRTGFREGVLKKKDIERVNVDTSVQEKNITFPTDAKLYYKGICLLGKMAKKYGIHLKQSFERIGKQSLIMQGRYSYAKQMKRAKKEIRRLKTYLGRLLRDVERKATVELKNNLRYPHLVSLIKKLLLQEKESKNKLYSFHAPEVECISKGKAHKRYEFGCKVGIVSSSRRNFILGASAFHGNPYDGHTLQENLDRAERLTSKFAKIKQAFVDQGYRRSGYEGEIEIHIVKRGLRRMKGYLKRWFRRRSGIEADIGHLKNDYRLSRNYLSGEMGDEINVLLSCAGFNLRKLWWVFLHPIFIWLKSAFQANFCQIFAELS
jgi:IS5 family transposase